MPTLVPGRSCGECNVCCSYYEIWAEFKKPCATLCQHWKTPGRCGIYDSRPAVCRDFYCQWRQNPTLGDWWRPDRCGVVIRETVDDIPEHYEIRQGLVFELAGDRKVIADDRFILAIASMIHQRIPVFLSITGPMGFGHRTIFLNDDMAGAVAMGIREHLLAGLRAALDELRRP
jgi:hypothetical protein